MIIPDVLPNVEYTDPETGAVVTTQMTIDEYVRTMPSYVYPKQEVTE